MKSDSIYENWLSSLDLTKTRVIRSPSFIFLCGGEITNDTEVFKSCRDIFFHYIKINNCSFKDNIILAEAIFRYFEHTSYKDLLLFEKDLAELCVLTVLFSESPGSIAELGSFSVLETIQDRLLVVMHQEDSHKESFIWRGPALYLKRIAIETGRQDPISIYYWPRTNQHLSSEDFTDAKDLEETIEQILSKVPKTEAWNKSKLGHIMLLMLDLLKVLQLANLDEITKFLNRLGINHKKQTVEQHLSLLYSLGLAVRKPYRNNVYYLSSSLDHWLSFAFIKEAQIREIIKWEHLFKEHYSKYEKQKDRALRSHMKSLGLIGD